MEPLKDPLNDRFLKNLEPPPARSLFHELLFPKSEDIPDWIQLKSHLEKQGQVSKQDLLQIITIVKSIFSKESNLLELMDPVTIIGDIHGQFYDLLKILELAGNILTTKYLFLGDMVDRGLFSIEVLLMLFSLKINFPSSVFILRGNHECRQLTSYFNFRNECLYKYDLETYEIIMDCFDKLPLACMVNNKFLALHGGLSPELKKISDILAIKRDIEPPRSGIFCDILWADPVENEGPQEKFKPNDARGCSFFFGGLAAKRFLKKNKLLSIIRGHEAQLDGYKVHNWNNKAKFPAVITVFSAPNYCDVYNNKGAIIKFVDNNLHITQYNYSPHPYILPNFMDIFSWSIPFVIEKILQMLSCIMKDRGDEIEERKTGEKKSVNKERKNEIKKKIKAISRLMKMFKNLRDENELLIELNGSCPDANVPKIFLKKIKSGLKGAVEFFNNAKQLDKINEIRPNN